jgi:predicted small lipoprotein YifL
MRSSHVATVATVALLAAPFALAALASVSLAGCGRPGPELCEAAGDITNAPSSCEDRAAAADALLECAREEDLSCEEDDECVLVSSETLCGAGCGRVARFDAVSAVDEARAGANEAWCSTYVEDGCAYATADCLALEVRCEDGTCTAAAVPN